MKADVKMSLSLPDKNEQVCLSLHLHLSPKPILHGYLEIICANSRWSAVLTKDAELSNCCFFSPVFWLLNGHSLAGSIQAHSHLTNKGCMKCSQVCLILSSEVRGEYRWNVCGVFPKVHLLDALTLFPAVKRLIWAADSREILDGSCSYCRLSVRCGQFPKY